MATATAIAELAELDQWVTWRYVTHKGKQDKIPFNPHSGRPASHSDPSTWSTYALACAAAQRAVGVGFVFHESDPYSGIDLDGCRVVATGAIEPWALRIVERLNSYTEISPSQTGLKIFVRGTLPANLKHTLGPHKGIEIYSKQRYFTVTGQHLAGTPTVIRDAQAELGALAAELRPKVEPPAVERQPIALASRPGGRASLADLRARFNAEHTIELLLLGYGATHTPGGYSCPWCQHTHETTLYISKRGKLFSYSPNCRLHTTKGYDAFGLYVAIEHNNDVVAAAKHLNPIEPRPRRQAPPLAEPRPRAPSDAAHNARRLEQRHADNRQALASLYDYVNTLQLPDRAVLLFAYLHQQADDLGLLQVRPTNAQIEEAIGLGERSIQRAFRDLEAAELGKRAGGRGGLDQPNQAAIWTFNRYAMHRVTAAPAPTADYVEPVTLHERTCDLDHPQTHGASERAPAEAPAPEPAPAAVVEPISEIISDLPSVGALGELVIGPAGAVAIVGGAAYVPAGAESWYQAMQPQAPQLDRALPAIAELPDQVEPDPLVRCPPIEPRAAAEYWSLKNKRAVNHKQARWIARRLAELEIYLPVSQALASLPPAPRTPRAATARRPAAGARAAPPSQATATSGLQLGLFEGTAARAAVW